MTYRLVIFDFDGTLADSASRFVKALNDLAPRHGFRPVTEAEIEMLRGRGNREIIRYLRLARWRLPFIAADLRRRAAADAASISLFDGVERLLDALHQNGVTCAIVSSSSEGERPASAGSYETLLVEATIEPGVAVGRHTHPGIESAYVMEGGFELPIEGQPTRVLKVGDAFQIPPETPHAGGKAGDAKTRILITYVVEKGKPLASPA